MLAVLGTGLVAGVAMGLPYYDIPPIGPLQPFGIIVAIGVLVGASVMRRYAENHGCDDDDLRGLLGWVTVCGFIGAHVFDVLAYQQDELRQNPIILIKIWQGISSYGGFLGGAAGYAFYVWWKRLTPGMWADATAIGLLVAFSIGRIACTLVHDHIGAATDSALGFDYPWSALEARKIQSAFAKAAMVRAHNLGFYELLYLIPVNAIVLWLGFKAKARPAGFIVVVVGALYAPVRFFLEFLRLNQSDPRYAGLTFAQWCSVAAFSVALFAAFRIWRHGQVAPLKAELDGKPGGKRVTIAAAKANESVKKKKKKA